VVVGRVRVEVSVNGGGVQETVEMTESSVMVIFTVVIVAVGVSIRHTADVVIVEVVEVPATVV
jgi:hypothetical protein